MRILINLLLAMLFSVGASIAAENIPNTQSYEIELLNKVRQKPWYQSLTPGQKNWFQYVTRSIASPNMSEAEAYFYSLSKPLVIYATKSLKNPIAQFPLVPHAILNTSEGYPDDWAGNGDKMRIIDHGPAALKVEYRSETGWISRSSIKMKSIIVARSDGEYLTDAFVNGISARGVAMHHLATKNAKLFVVIEYKKNYKHENVKCFGFEYQPESNKIVDIVEWDMEEPGAQNQQRLGDALPADTLDRLSTEIGFGKIPFFRHMENYERRRIFGSPLNEDTPVIQNDGFMLINAITWASVANGHKHMRNNCKN